MITAKTAELDRAAAPRAGHPGLSDLCSVARWTVDRSEQRLLEPVGVEQDALVAVSPRVGPDIGDQEGRAEVVRHDGQVLILARRTALGRHLRQVLRVAVALDPEREVGVDLDAWPVERRDVDERDQALDATPEVLLVLGRQGRGGYAASGGRRVSACRLVPTTSLPVSASPMALTAGTRRGSSAGRPAYCSAGWCCRGCRRGPVPRRRRHSALPARPRGRG